MAEAAIVDKIRRELRRHGAWVVKIHGSSMQVAGLPDLVVCYRGRFVGLEVKQPGHNATALQAYTLNEIREAGGLADVVRSVPDALKVLGIEGG